jgi:hypothetical protein
MTYKEMLEGFMVFTIWGFIAFLVVNGYIVRIAVDNAHAILRLL